jgi:hypothetical protein
MATSTTGSGPLGAREPALAEPGHEELWDAVGSDAEQALGNVVRLVFPSRAQADEAISALRSVTGPRTMSISPAPGLHAPVIDSEARTSALSARHYAGLVATFGLVAGLAAGLAGLTTLPTVAGMALLGMLGAGFGGLVGALVGLALADPFDDDPLVEVDAGPDAVVLTVRSLRAVRIREMGRALGGIPIDPRSPLSSG